MTSAPLEPDISRRDPLLDEAIRSLVKIIDERFGYEDSTVWDRALRRIARISFDSGVHAQKCVQLLKEAAEEEELLEGLEAREQERQIRDSIDRRGEE